MKSLEENIGYTFKNKELLKRALTHTSYAYEKGVQSNEKLEFLGDSILEFISSIYIYQNYPTLKEGEMTKVRATVVCEDSLYKIAIRLKFNEFLYLGNSEIKGKEQIRKAILADHIENNDACSLLLDSMAEGSFGLTVFKGCHVVNVAAPATGCIAAVSFGTRESRKQLCCYRCRQA